MKIRAYSLSLYVLDDHTYLKLKVLGLHAVFQDFPHHRFLIRLKCTYLQVSFVKIIFSPEIIMFNANPKRCFLTQEERQLVAFFFFEERQNWCSIFC